jgi:ADP-ribosylglycohydrolase
MSAVWSTWADALGFISELTDEAGLKRRLQNRRFDAPMAWKRRIGGRFGVEVELPAGCYSDDTQLRLCTARAISDTGFDVEAFARVELTLWPAYAIGGGRATKAACANLSKVSTPWFANFYAGWHNAGGNGVAMRIQPHVWAAPRPAELGGQIHDLLLNGITTHGHPRALVGAVFHALTLGCALEAGSAPTPKQWPDVLRLCADAVGAFDNDSQLGTVWRPQWEKVAARPFREVWLETVEELSSQLVIAQSAALPLQDASTEAALRDAYEDLVGALRLRDPSCRGAGTNTAAAAATLALGLQGQPERAASVAAGALGTDTDTIATMATAICGAVTELPPSSPVLDNDYVMSEAARLANIAMGQPTTPFSYPDLLHWTPPKSQLDAVGLAGDRLALAGLAWLSDRGGEPITKGRDAWQWTASDLGASFLVKRRLDLRSLPEGNWPVRREPRRGMRRHAEGGRMLDGQLTFGETERMPAAATSRSAPSVVDPGIAASDGDATHSSVDVDQMLAWIARNGFTDDAVGYAMRRISELGSVEQLVAFATALRAAMRHQRPESHRPQ